jgi:hypothetical protein
MIPMTPDNRNLLFNILDTLSEIEYLLGGREPEAQEKIRLLTQRIIINGRDDNTSSPDDPPLPYDLFH